jgi:hypothetical protein
MIYLDTSALIAALAGEKDGPRVRAWFGRQDVGSLFVSRWSDTEISSALSKKVRVETLSIDQQRDALIEWHLMRDESLCTLNVQSSHFETAAKFADRHDLNIRSGDALHLAIAAAHGHRLLTLDRRMAEAAPILGIPLAVLDADAG